MRVGVVLCLISAAGFGAMAIFGKLAFDAGVGPDAVVMWRFVFAAVLLWIVQYAVGRHAPAPKVPRRAVATALGMGAIGYALQASCYFLALERADASVVTLVLYTYPAMVAVAAAALGRDRLNRQKAIALVAATSGTALVLFGPIVFGTATVAFDVVGVLLAFGGALTYTVYILVGDGTVKQMPPLQLTALVMTGAAVSLTLRSLAIGSVDFSVSARGWLWIGCIVVVSTVIASTAFFAGLHRTGPTTASILSTFEPITTITLAALVLGERISLTQFAGGLLVIGSVLLLQMRTRPRVAAHEPVASAS